MWTAEDKTRGNRKRRHGVSPRAVAPRHVPLSGPLRLLRSCPCGGGCPSCREAGLPVSKPDEPAEREAERVAETVVHRAAEPSPDGAARQQRQPAVALPAANGRPLPRRQRDGMEAAFGADFSGVRVHADPGSAGMAEALRARAFTVGSHIWLGAGERLDDVRLLAHELTHVLQQTGGQRFDRGLAVEPESRQPAVIQRTPFPGETEEQEARRRAIIDAANTARARLVDALARGQLWPEESEVEGGVSSLVSGETETIEAREARLRGIVRDLIGLVRELESGPVPEAWLETELREPGGSLSIGSETRPAWLDTVAAYANRAQAAGMSLDEVYFNLAYINTDPLPGRRITPARISPRGINIGAWIVVPDPENAPLDYYLLTGFEEVRGPIMEVWEDDFGYFYMYKGERHYLPRSPWR